MIQIGLLLACCAQVACAQTRPDDGPVRLTAIEGSDLRFVRQPFGYREIHRSIVAIVQDDQGFLWFATHDGLSRYDGYRFRQYRHEPNDPHSMSGSHVTTLFKDRSGKLWVASDRSLDAYDPVTERFVPFSKGRTDFDGPVWRINQDRAGVLWFATENGLNKLDPVTGQMTRYQHAPADGHSLGSNHVTATLEDKNGTFWVATSAGLEVLDRNTEKFTCRIPKVKAEGAIFALFEDRSNRLWASSMSGLAIVDRQANKLTRPSLESAGAGDTPFPTAEAHLEDRNGTLWLGTKRGLLRLARDGREIVRYRHDRAEPGSLNANHVTALFEDREGTIWVATLGGGLSRLNRQLPFRRYCREADDTGGADEDEVYAVCEDSRGIVWAMNQRGLNRVDRATGRITPYRADGGAGSNIPGSVALSVVEDRHGHLWLGTVGRGLVRLDPLTGRVVTYRHDAADSHSLGHDTVNAMLVDHEGTLWAGTNDGVCAFDPPTDGFRVYRNAGRRNRISAIAEGADGNLWLGTADAGVQRLDPATGQFEVYRHTDGLAGSLSSDGVNSVCATRAGVVWAGTPEGLNRFDPATRTFTVYTESDGLPNRRVTGILEDEHGELWLTTHAGLSRHDPVARTFRNYFASDGLASDSFVNFNVACKARNGELFLGSRAGLIGLLPGQLTEDLRSPPVVLTEFQVAGRPVSIGNDSVLQQSITMTRSLTLSHEDIFSFEFAVLNFANPEENRYRYRLAPMQTRWTDTDSDRRLAMFTTLPPGNYVFQVQGSNHRGVWNESGALVHIEILAPWWARWWFRGVCAAMLAILASAAYYARVRGIARHNRELAEQVDQRTHELRESEERFRGTFENAAVGIAHVDHEGRFLRVNENYCAILGYSRDELTRMTVQQLTDPDDLATSLPPLRAVLDSESSGVILERRCLRKDGSVVWVASSVAPQRDTAGRTAYAISVIADISERKRLDAELEKAKEAAEAASRAKSEFLASMSHEIRTPMNGVFGMLDLALDTDLPPEQRHYVERARASADLLLRVINDILDFSKIEAGRLDLEPAPFSLRECLGEAIKAFGPRAHRKALELVLHVPSGTPDGVVGDALRLGQVLNNLLGNAIKFTDRGEVILRAGVESASEGQVCLHFAVTDTGPGIPADKQQLIFEAFAQADSSMARRFGGTGLGLAISARLVELMGGRIWVESQVGKGSTFHFTACFGLHGTPVSRPQADRIDLEGLPVLAADDNDTTRAILAEMLANWRMRPTTAGSGREALAEMKRAAATGEPFPLVLLDALMPDMDGFAVAREIKNDPALAGATIMMLSSADRGGELAQCRELGIAAYLRKPLKQSELLNAVLAALGGLADSGTRPARPGVSAPAARRGLRILVAEDNEFNQEFAVNLLKKWGHVAVVAGDGKTALAAWERQPFDLILMDVQMPDLDGFVVTRAIREKERSLNAHIPIVALTAHAMKGDRERCLAAGMDAYASKPVRASELADIIARLLPPNGEGSQEKPAPRGAPGSVFDPEAALAVFDGDRDLLGRMIQAFREQSPKLLGQLRDAVVRGDGAAIALAAHSLKGALGSIGGQRAYQTALRLEELGGAGEAAAAREAYLELEQEVGRLHDTLADFVRKSE
jgi:two-component system, sensor histidine kinase and response regulator